MIDFSKRSRKKELLDYPNISWADIRQNMKELNTINTYLGGHAVTIAGVKKIIQKNYHQKNVTFCEIGCGGGDNLRAIEKWCTKNNIKATFIGIDHQASCIDYAKNQYPQMNALWIVNDFKQVKFDQKKPEIIFSSLFTHHFSETEITHILLWMKEHASMGFFINDLHRHSIAYFSIRVITYLFSKSNLVRHDAPLSVLRGLVKKEWISICRKVPHISYSIQWKWAFRYLIVCQK